MNRAPSIAAIGTFDGVHAGHRAVLQALRTHALERALRPLALVFVNHPLEVVDPARVPPFLMSPQRKLEAVRDEGVEAVPMVFTAEMLRESAEAFMTRLRDDLNCRALLLGYDNRIGCEPYPGREAYAALGASLGLEVIGAPKVEGVSSTRLRADIAAGGPLHSYVLDGEVVHGRALGRTMGFPTANLLPWSPRALLPAPGVYAVMAAVEGRECRAVTNVGTRPTLEAGDGSLSVETFIPGYEGDLYGKPMSLTFVERLRDEKKFDDLQALKKQLALDADMALKILQNY